MLTNLALSMILTASEYHSINEMLEEWALENPEECLRQIKCLVTFHLKGAKRAGFLSGRRQAKLDYLAVLKEHVLQNAK